MNKTGKTVFFAVLTAFTLVYIGWRVIFTVPYDHDALSVIFAWVLLLAEILGAAGLIGFFGFYVSEGEKPKEPAFPPKSGYPAVDVFVTTCGESVELLKKTLSACLAMEYRGRFGVWLLDDRGRPEMKELAARLGAGYLARSGHEHAKAGNLNAALKKTNAPLVAVFDADMAPRPEFLERTVPYMTRGVGYVQTPQSFRNPDLFQKAAGRMKIPNEQDFFYRSIEPARNAVNAVVLAGSNMLISRKALRDVGGFAVDTVTEDFATGIALQQKGYRGVALAETLAEGLAPDSLGALIRQRRRWARGCIQSGRKARLLFGRKLSFGQRMSYLIAVSYWFFPLKRLIYFAAPLLYSLFGIAVMRCDPMTACIFWLPMYLLTVVGLPVFSGRTRTVGWSMFYETCLAPFLLGSVVAEALGFRQKVFQVTDKSGKNDWHMWMTVPHLLILVLAAAALVCSVRLSVQEQTFRYALLIVWNLYHLYLALCGELFVLNCKKSRPEKPASELPHRLSGRALAALKLPGLFVSLFNKGNAA